MGAVLVLAIPLLIVIVFPQESGRVQQPQVRFLNQ